MANGFTVTSVSEQLELAPSGNLTKVVNITFELDNGAGGGTVSVPLTGDWQAAATAAVQKRAAEMLAVLEL